MVKRKAQSDSENESEAQFSDPSSISKAKPQPAAKKKAVAKKTKPEFDAGTGSSAAKIVKSNVLSSTAIHKHGEGDQYIDLGKRKRATVRSFKDIPLLDIREFYSAGSDEKPGKKGISLTTEQWQVLKENSDTIDRLFSELSKGKK